MKVFFGGVAAALLGFLGIFIWYHAVSRFILTGIMHQVLRSAPKLNVKIEFLAPKASDALLNPQ